MYTANVSISFLTDGDRTVFEGAYHSYNFPAVRATGSSSREPGDKSSKEIGEALAAARFLRSLAAKLEKQASGKMKHREDIAVHRAEIEFKKKLKEQGWAETGQVSAQVNPDIDPATNRPYPWPRGKKG